MDFKNQRTNLNKAKANEEKKIKITIEEYIMNNSFRFWIPLILLLILSSGCASIPMETEEMNSKAKIFNPPSEGNSGLYIYRNSWVGKALKKDVWVDGKCIGETAPDVFFYEAVEGDATHKVSTESEFSPNDLIIRAKSGMNYFIRQYIKLGVFVGGADLELVDEEKGKEEVSELNMATKGICSNKADIHGTVVIMENLTN